MQRYSEYGVESTTLLASTGHSGDDAIILPQCYFNPRVTAILLRKPFYAITMRIAATVNWNGMQYTYLWSQLAG